MQIFSKKLLGPKLRNGTFGKNIFENVKNCVVFALADLHLLFVGGSNNRG